MLSNLSVHTITFSVHHLFLLYHSDEWQPQQEGNDSNDQDQHLSAQRPPQVTWEQVYNGCGQAVHAQTLWARSGKLSTGQ